MFTEEDKVISRVAKESRAFVSDNLRTLFKLMLPLIPFIIICDIGEYLMIQNYQEYIDYSPFKYFSAVLYGVFALSWHKLFMHGADSDYKTSLLSLNNNDVKFLGVIVLFNVIATGMSIISSPLSDLSMIVVFPSAIIITVLFIWISLRVSLYFPAAAYGEPMTLKQAYKNGIGLPWQLFCSSFLAVFRILLVMIAANLSVVYFLSSLFPVLNSIISLIYNTLFTALTVTVLSQYYLIWRKESGLEVR